MLEYPSIIRRKTVAARQETGNTRLSDTSCPLARPRKDIVGHVVAASTTWSRWRREYTSWVLTCRRSKTWSYVREYVCLCCAFFQTKSYQFALSNCVAAGCENFLNFVRNSLRHATKILCFASKKKMSHVSWTGKNRVVEMTWNFT